MISAPPSYSGGSHVSETPKSVHITVVVTFRGGPGTSAFHTEKHGLSVISGIKAEKKALFNDFKSLLTIFTPLLLQDCQFPLAHQCQLCSLHSLSEQVLQLLLSVVSDSKLTAVCTVSGQNQSSLDVNLSTTTYDFASTIT